MKIWRNNHIFVIIYAVTLTAIVGKLSWGLLLDTIELILWWPQVQFKSFLLGLFLFRASLIVAIVFCIWVVLCLSGIFSGKKKEPHGQITT